MAIGSNISESIALQRPNRNDYWMRRLADDMRLAKEAEKKRKQQEADQLATLMDFKIDYSKYLPAWGKKITEIYAGMVNNVAKMRQGDPNVSYYALKNEVERAKQEMANYEIGNKMAMDYIARKDIMKNPDYVRAMVSTESTLESLYEMSNAGFYVTSPTGSFFYREVSNEAPKIEWGEYDRKAPAYDEKGNARFYDTKGQRYNIIVKDFSPTRETAVINQQLLDPVYRMQTLFRLSSADKKYQQDINTGMTDYDYAAAFSDDIDREIANDVKRVKPGPAEDIDPLPTGGSWGRKPRDKNNYPVESTTHTWPNSGVTTDSYIKVTPVETAIKISSNGEFITKDGKFIPEVINGKTPAFYFRPTQVQLLLVKTGENKYEYKPYARGTITMNAQSDQEQTFAQILELSTEDQDLDKYKWTQTSDIFVPLEGTGVQGLIEERNYMTNFYSTLDEVTRQQNERSRKGGGGGGGAGDDIF